MKTDNWAAQVEHMLKMELRSRKMSYADLADKLAAIGVEENEKTFREALSRRFFSFSVLRP